MIKIIQGIFGLKVGNTIIPKSAKDEPFSCDEATEKRLVNSGVAIYADESESIVEFEDLEAEVDNEAPLYTDKTSLAELKEIAKTLGATDDILKSIRAKAAAKELIDKLADEITKGEPVDGPNESEIVEVVEDAPTFDAVDGVV